MASAPDRLCLIDLRQDDFVTEFNPLAGMGDVYSRALHLLGVLRYNSESWGIQLEETLRNSLVALTESNWTILEIEPLLCDSRFRTEVLKKVRDPYVRSFFARFDALSADKQVSWSLPVLNKVTPLLSVPQLRLMFGSVSGLDWTKLLATPGQVILISLAVDRFHDAAHLVGGMLVSQIQSAVMARANVPEKRRTPVKLFVDEFETMASWSRDTHLILMYRLARPWLCAPRFSTRFAGRALAWIVLLLFIKWMVPASGSIAGFLWSVTDWAFGFVSGSTLTALFQQALCPIMSLALLLGLLALLLPSFRRQLPSIMRALWRCVRFGVGIGWKLTLLSFSFLDLIAKGGKPHKPE